MRDGTTYQWARELASLSDSELESLRGPNSLSSHCHLDASESHWAAISRPVGLGPDEYGDPFPPLKPKHRTTKRLFLMIVASAAPRSARPSLAIA